MSETLLYTPERAARILAISPRTLRRWENDGRIKSVEIGGVKRFSRRELERVTYGDDQRQERAEGFAVAPAR